MPAVASLSRSHRPALPSRSCTEWEAPVNAPGRVTAFDGSQCPNPVDLPCFIATAAYGHPMHGHLHSLRWARDNVLPAAAVSAYYAASPPVARAIAHSPAARAAVRAALAPVVAAIEQPVAAAVTVGAVGAAALLSRVSAGGASKI